MITYDEACRIAQQQVDSWDIRKDLPLMILLEDTIERKWGWVFFYTSRPYHETGDIRYMLFGNAPFIVERESGRVRVLGTGLPVDRYLDNYERYGDPHIGPSAQICLTGVRHPVDKLAAIKLLRASLENGLQPASQIVEDCVAGRQACFTPADPGVTDHLAESLESMGFVVVRPPA